MESPHIRAVSSVMTLEKKWNGLPIRSDEKKGKKIINNSKPFPSEILVKKNRKRRQYLRKYKDHVNIIKKSYRKQHSRRRWTYKNRSGRITAPDNRFEGATRHNVCTKRWRPRDWTSWREEARGSLTSRADQLSTCTICLCVRLCLDNTYILRECVSNDRRRTHIYIQSCRKYIYYLSFFS